MSSYRKEINQIEGNIYEISKSVRCKKRGKKICTKENNHTIQYLRSSTICLRLRSFRDFTIHMEKYKIRQYDFLSQKQHQTLISKTKLFLSCAQDSQLTTKQATDYQPKS